LAALELILFPQQQVDPELPRTKVEEYFLWQFLKYHSNQGDL